MLQPVEYINTNCFKIGLSSTCDLNRLKSYGVGSRYIHYFECSNYREAETELIHNLRIEKSITLFKGREYFCGSKRTILKIFIQIMLKYTDMEEYVEEFVEENEVESVEDKVEKIIEKAFIEKIIETKNVRQEVLNNNKKQYTCKACEYITDIKSNFNKHIKTKLHLENLNHKNACSKCFKLFGNKWNKNRHEKTCK
jgi:hypothetical protein